MNAQCHTPTFLKVKKKENNPMADNIDKNIDLENLEDSDLEQVSGGVVYAAEEDGKRCPKCGVRLHPDCYDFDDDRGYVEIWFCDQCGFTIYNTDE